jgi:uncharacterized protein YjbI with pentapeptide repeats
MEKPPPAASASAAGATPEEKAQDRKPRRRGRVPQWTGFRRKTLWDWLQLLIVPAILIAVTFVWSATQTRSDNKREDRRVAADRAAAEEARRDATLQAYLNEMSGLMLDRKLLTSKKSAAVRPVARSVTLTTLRRLDGNRRAAVLRFLYEARLVDGKTAVVTLIDADFRGVDLTYADFTGANLQGANLQGAKLSNANLRIAKLAVAKLNGANLFKSNLTDAELDGAELKGAKLTYADLTDASLFVANLDGANLFRAQIPGANLSVATLVGANLESAHLKSSDLDDADLRSANLRHANLDDAILTGANLSGAHLDDASLVGADLSRVEGLDLARFVAGLPPDRQKEFLASQKAFLDSLSAEELAKFNLSPAKLARIRREASGG